jgi:hypothetical protein
LEGAWEPEFFGINDDDFLALRTKETPQGPRVHNVNDLGWHDHCQATARPKQGERREDEWHPSICVLGELAVQLVEDALGSSLKDRRQILIPDKWRVP